MIYTIRTQMIGAKNSESKYPYTFSIQTDHGISVSIEMTETIFQEFYNYIHILKGTQKYAFVIPSITEYERHSWKDDGKEETE